jgi:hypothetical protein
MNMAGGDHNPISLPAKRFRAKMGSDRHFFARFKARFSKFKGRFSPFRTPFGHIAGPSHQSYTTPAEGVSGAGTAWDGL